MGLWPTRANSARGKCPKCYSPLPTFLIIIFQLTSASLFDFSNLLHLQHLDLSNNTIDSLSDSLFQQGSKLQELFVDHNQVSSLPPTMALIANILKTFSIASNNLIELPYLLKDFSKLKVLNLKVGLICFLLIIFRIINLRISVSGS